MSDSIGFIGLGNIGRPIARRLLQYGEALRVYDVSTTACDELAALGALTVSPAEMAARCHYIGLCVRDDADVESLLYGTDGLLACGPAGGIIAIHSTVTQAALLRWHRDAVAVGITLIDAPISGGASGAAAGTLTYMVGCDDTDALARCTPIWNTSAATIVHAGSVGAGIALKLANNLMTYAAFAAIHEASALADAMGLSIDKLIEVGSANGVVTPQMQAFIRNRSQLAASGGHAALRQHFGPFGALGQKDLNAALACAEALHVKLPATSALAPRISAIFEGRNE